MRQGWGDLPWFGENDLIVWALLASATGLIAWILLGLPAQGSPQAAVDSSVAVDGPEAHITVGHVHAARDAVRHHLVTSRDFVNRWVDLISRWSTAPRSRQFRPLPRWNIIRGAIRMAIGPKAATSTAR
jgi:hypothetical protein